MSNWFAVDFLGPPGRFFAYVGIAFSLLAIVYVGVWNANRYPITLGYDSTAHLSYGHVILRQHRMPTASESGEYNHPPAYYVIASVAAAAGHKIFGWNESVPLSTPEPSYRGAKYLNVLLVLGTALCLLWIARVVAPRNEGVWTASVGFFAFLPVVAKTAAMFHPETLNMFTSTAALAASTDMLVKRRFRWWVFATAVLSMTLGLLTRQSAIFTLAALILGFLGALTVSRFRRAVRWRRLATGVAILAAVGLPWFLYQEFVRHQTPFHTSNSFFQYVLHPSTSPTGIYRGPFFHMDVVPIFQHPFRGNYGNEAFPETYTDIWGDWFGAFAWSAYSGVPRADVNRVMVDQSYIGILPTALALLGWLALLVLAVVRRRELLALALLPPLALAAYFYRAWAILTSDGDLFKATYVITTAPIWALAFGIATWTITRRSRTRTILFSALFLTYAVLELRFMMYGIRDHHPIF